MTSFEKLHKIPKEVGINESAYMISSSTVAPNNSSKYRKFITPICCPIFSARKTSLCLFIAARALKRSLNSANSACFNTCKYDITCKMQSSTNTLFISSSKDSSWLFSDLENHDNTDETRMLCCRRSLWFFLSFNAPNALWKLSKRIYPEENPILNVVHIFSTPFNWFKQFSICDAVYNIGFEWKIK